MSVSTDAILFYGYCWGEEIDLLEKHATDNEDYPDWEDVILKKRGIVDPWDAYPDIDPVLPWAERDRLSKEWVAANDAVIKTRHLAEQGVRDEFECEIGRHGSDGWSLPFIAIASSEIRAYRGESKPLLGWPTTGDDWGRLGRET